MAGSDQASDGPQAYLAHCLCQPGAAPPRTQSEGLKATEATICGPLGRFKGWFPLGIRGEIRPSLSTPSRVAGNPWGPLAPGHISPLYAFSVPFL